jgi:hypothetical protein
MPPDAIYITYFPSASTSFQHRAGNGWGDVSDNCWGAGKGRKGALAAIQMSERKICVYSSIITMLAELIEMKIWIFVLKRFIPGISQWEIEKLPKNPYTELVFYKVTYTGYDVH